MHLNQITHSNFLSEGDSLFRQLISAYLASLLPSFYRILNKCLKLGTVTGICGDPSFAT